jgi:nucleoside-diphosphate-sugar epimerase/dTDP-4-dehydrorhamnose 3,5-epimerase-like enzyme
MKVLLHNDTRGQLESLKDLPFAPKEILVASNKKGTLKGLHISPYRKIVYVSMGKIHDFFVERPPFSFATTEQVLSPGQWLDVPAYAGHGFFCEEDSLVLYLLEEAYDPSKDRTMYWASPEVTFHHAFLKKRPSLLLSDADSAAPYAIKYDYVVLGPKGFIGSHVLDTLRQLGRRVFPCDLRLHDIEGLRDVLTRSRAPYVICAAGISGNPTIEWSETHERETFETNFLETCNLIRLCHSLSKHLTYFGSGLVYSFRQGERTEEDTPDWVGKVYCRYRVMLEEVIRRNYITNHLLYLRVLYPCSFNNHKSCFFQKMLKRTCRVNPSRVSLTILPDLLPLLPHIIEDKKHTGVLNFVNQGSLTLSELLQVARVDHHVTSPSESPTISEVLSTANLGHVVGKVPCVLTSVAHYTQTHYDESKNALI